MSTIAEIQEAVRELSDKEKVALTAWLESQEEPILTPQQEAALLAALDKAAHELDAGRGVPLAKVRESVAKWATK